LNAPRPQPPLTRRAVAYITHGDRLLVFRHTQHPEAGIQVPGGKIEDGEAPDVGALREAYEETGLKGLQLQSYLGHHDLDLAPYGRQGTLRMLYYHLTFDGHPPERWLHYEQAPSDGSPGPIEFELYWVRFPEEVPALVGEQGLLLDQLEPNRDAKNR
jgi:8-oxo-dGTP pyrophosphatase MutT (NUDIX family)